jgi:putative aldouronate transport system permease protein
LSKKRFGAIEAVIYSFLTLLSLTMLYPYWYILMYSFSDPMSIALNQYFFIPNGFSLQNYVVALSKPTIYSGFVNSVFITVVGTVLHLFVTSMLAFPLSRRRLEGKNVILSALFLTMLVSAGIIPTYLQVKNLHLLNSLWALIIPNMINVFNLLIMLKFFRNIPEEMIESARIDGYNDFRILIRIILPVSKPVLAALGLFFAVHQWNIFFPALLYISDPKKWPIMAILNSMLQQLQESTSYDLETRSQVTPESLKNAIIILSITPILIVYPFLQKYFVKGIMIGSIKG